MEISTLGPRGVGRTTKDLLSLPRGSLYIVHHFAAVDRVRRDLAKLDREDISVEPWSRVRDGSLRGTRWPGIDIDHAVSLNKDEWMLYRALLLQVRP